MTKDEPSCVADKQIAQLYLLLLQGGFDMINKYTTQFKIGSALIMTIVLTVLLSAVAVMFIAVARMDRAATANIADNKMLDTAAQSLIEIISQQLVYDTPGVAKKAKLDANKYPDYFEYKDYPDACDPWLASTVPYYDRTEANEKDRYNWQQISDVTGYLKEKGFSTRKIKVKPEGLSTKDVVREYPVFEMDENGNFKNAPDGVSADADGDGIADSKWIELREFRTPTGRVFAAVRVIDNSSMLNVNTAFKFDPNSNEANEVDGKAQWQINLDKDYGGLLKDDISALHQARCNGQSLTDLNKFADSLIWDFSNLPINGYLPFDMSDELELRYRFCINGKNQSRFEKELPSTTASSAKIYNGDSGYGILDWGDAVREPNLADRRHLLTTYNCDRIIDPNGDKMLNINTADINKIYNVFHKVYDANTAAQIAVNLVDYRDADSNVTKFSINGGNTFYGFERPCIYISEIAHRQITIPIPNLQIHESYAIELYKPYASDVNVDDKWSLWIGGSPGQASATEVKINWTGDQFHTIRYQDSNIPLYVNGSVQNITVLPDNFKNAVVLTRQVNGDILTVDAIGFARFTADGNQCIQRDTSKHKAIMKMRSPILNNQTSLGLPNPFSVTDPNIVPAHPADACFTNVGQIGEVFRKKAYLYTAADVPSWIGTSADVNHEPDVRINIADSNVAPLFNYITALDTHWPGETCVKGRININTAPALVIAQLPWVSHGKNVKDPNLTNLAGKIVSYRDDVNGFSSIADLMQVEGMDYYSRFKKGDESEFPDLSAGDLAADDFEERDLIFARISDLITVRSDVFTAYILVRVGTEGPQKRYIAVLDRSHVTKPTDKVQIRAFQYVPDAR